MLAFEAFKARSFTWSRESITWSIRIYDYIFIRFWNKTTFLRIFKKIKKENLRFYIQIRVKLEQSCQYIYKDLKSAIPSMVPLISTINWWFKHFESGNKSLEDQQNHERLITDISKSNINIVLLVIENNRYLIHIMTKLKLRHHWEEVKILFINH